MESKQHPRNGSELHLVKHSMLFNSGILVILCFGIFPGGGGSVLQTRAMATAPLAPTSIPVVIPSVETDVVDFNSAAEKQLRQPSIIRSAVDQRQAEVGYLLVSTTQNFVSDEPVTRRQPIDASVSALPKQPSRRNHPGPRPKVNHPVHKPSTDLPPLRIATVPEESTATEPLPIQRVTVKPLDLQPVTWPECPVLQRQLERLGAISALSGWSGQTQQQLLSLHAARGFDSLASVTALAKLRVLQSQGIQKAAILEDVEQRTALFQMLSGLKRRLAIWHAVQAINTNGQDALTEDADGRMMVTSALKEIDERLDGSPESDNWSVYLMLETLKQYTMADAVLDVRQRTVDAQRVLTRMHSNYLTSEQIDLLSEKPFVALEQGLRHWCAEPIDYAQLLFDIEQYEAGRFSYQAVPVAAGFQSIRWSADKPVAQLGVLLDQHYRSGNIRIRIAEDLINRLLPAQTHNAQEINDKVSGAEVTGTSTTTTQLNVRLHADGLRWVIGVEADGNIETETTSEKGPATFKNESTASFNTTKQMFISPSGIEYSDTSAEVDSESKLVEFKTDYDSSLLSGLARNMAKKQYRQKEKQASKELEQRIRDQATTILDDKVSSGIGKVDHQFSNRWLEPMRQLQLSPVATQLRTTESQLIVDYRLAGIDQLAAFGYRPEYTGESLVSVQVHESAMNNLLHKLALDGTSGSLRDVMEKIGKQLGFEDYEVPSEIPPTVTLKLNTRDAIRIRFYDGRVQLLMQFKELRNNRILWKNFAVLVEFFPQGGSINGNLKREGVIQIIGRGLRLGDRIALQTIFNKVVPSTREISLLGSSIAEHPNFSDTMISTFQVQHGWLTYRVSADPAVQTVGHEMVEIQEP